MRTPLFALLNLAMLTSTLLASGCVFERDREAEPREGYYDHEHHRWYHEHGWVVCDEREAHCHD
jgi:hypothetical protein